MKRVFIVGLLIISCFKGFSQNSKLSLDINYPIPVGDNFIGKNYNGIFDLGIKYNFVKISKFRLGMSANIGQLVFHSDIPVKALMMKPRINAELTFGKLIPYAGIGYSFFNYNVDSNSSDIDKTNDGININLGLKFNIVSKVYLNFGFDFIKFRTEEMVNNSYNRNIEIFEIGVGIGI
jgi:hypothetical protein